MGDKRLLPFVRYFCPFLSFLVIFKTVKLTSLFLKIPFKAQ